VLDIGLTATEAARRLQLEDTTNCRRLRSAVFFGLYGRWCGSPMFALLIAGGVVYLLLGDRMEAILLLAFASISVSITIVPRISQREGIGGAAQPCQPAGARGPGRQADPDRRTGVVRGDVIIVGEGDRVAADATLLKAHDLMLDESLLTGESAAVRKLAPALDVPIDAAGAVAGGEDSPFVFAGTLVVRGSAMCLSTPPARTAKWERSQGSSYHRDRAAASAAADELADTGLCHRGRCGRRADGNPIRFAPRLVAASHAGWNRLGMSLLPEEFRWS